MIVVKLSGGLANQMFQYAFAKRASINCKTRVKFDITIYDKPWMQAHEYFQLGIFQNIPLNFSNRHRIFFYKRKTLFKSSILLKWYKSFLVLNIVEENEFSYKPEKLSECTRNSYIDGYWQSEKYFIEIRSILLNEFSFPVLTKQNKTILEKILNTNSVSVHVRRGDFLNNLAHGSCSLEYYSYAIKKIRELVESPFFFFFSDDIHWVKQNMESNNNITFIDWNFGVESYNDMHLMSLCKHNIIANSSFSWWGAWLNQNPNKIVIAPKKWFNQRNWDTSNLLPPNWLCL